jgi:hypothetical protein
MHGYSIYVCKIPSLLYIQNLKIAGYFSKRKTLTGTQYSAFLENKNRGMIYHTKSSGFCVGYSKNMRIPTIYITNKNIIQYMHIFVKYIQTSSTRR